MGEECMSRLRQEIQTLVQEIVPLDALERDHRAYALQWLESGAEIFRTAKPATPDPHLVTYFLLVDEAAGKVLLVDHKKAQLWLPTGGHVEPDEHPQETIRRELQEELQVEPEFLQNAPLFLTVTKTQGSVAEHTDITLWYVLRGSWEQDLEYDREEFQAIRWFSLDALPLDRTDPHLRRFMQKLQTKLKGQTDSLFKY